MTTSSTSQQPSGSEAMGSFRIKPTFDAPNISDFKPDEQKPPFNTLHNSTKTKPSDYPILGSGSDNQTRKRIRMRQINVPQNKDNSDFVTMPTRNSQPFSTIQSAAIPPNLLDQQPLNGGEYSFRRTDFVPQNSNSNRNQPNALINLSRRFGANNFNTIHQGGRSIEDPKTRLCLKTAAIRSQSNQPIKMGQRLKSFKANNIIFSSKITQGNQKQAEKDNLDSTFYGASQPGHPVPSPLFNGGSFSNSNHGGNKSRQTKMPYSRTIQPPRIDSTIQDSFLPEISLMNIEDSLQETERRKYTLIKQAFEKIKKRAPEPHKVAAQCNRNENLLQEKRFKQWFKSRGIMNAHSQYYFTGAEVKADTIIEDMFMKLDSDGGGTLDFGEITALFAQNGIHMSQEAIANMFGEAARLNKLSHYRKKVQDGFVDKLVPSEVEPKDTEFYLSQKLTPDKFKIVAKSPAALQKFKQELKKFRDEMARKKQLYYIPVTMDELMARFVTNMERADCNSRFNEQLEVVMQDNLISTEREEVEEAVTQSIMALKDLLGVNTIDMERQPNSENKLYLSIIERIQEEEKFRLINMPSTKEANVIKTGKPAHLAVLKILANKLKNENQQMDTGESVEQSVEREPKSAMSVNRANTGGGSWYSPSKKVNIQENDQ